MEKVTCEDCPREHGKDGFHDLVIPNWAWRQISTNGSEGGLLCPSCLIARLDKKGIKCCGALMSGSVETVSRIEMETYRRAENCWETLEANNISWAPPITSDI